MVHDAGAWKPWTGESMVGKGEDWGDPEWWGGNSDNWTDAGTQDFGGGDDMTQNPSGQDFTGWNDDPAWAQNSPQQNAGGVPNQYQDYITAYQQAQLNNQARQLDQQAAAENNRHEAAMQQAQTYAQQVAEQRRHNKALEELDRLKTAVQYETAELDRRMQLVTQGAFGSRAQLDLMKGALGNPWMQNLTGMAPGFGTPGWGPESGGILKGLFEGWNPPPGYNFQTMSDYDPQFSAGSILKGKTAPQGGGGGGGSQTVQPSPTFDRPGYKQAKQDWRTGGKVGDKPSKDAFIAQAATDAATGNTGNSPVGQQLSAGWGGYAPVGETPPEPKYDQFSQMSPFEQSSYRATAEMAQPWQATQNSLQRSWADQGVTQAPKTTALTAAANGPLGIQQRQNTAEIFGNSPESYWKDQSRTWSKASSPNVSPW